MSAEAIMTATAKVATGRAGETREIVETRQGSRILALLVALKALGNEPAPSVAKG